MSTVSIGTTKSDERLKLAFPWKYIARNHTVLLVAALFLGVSGTVIFSAMSKRAVRRVIQAHDLIGIWHYSSSHPSCSVELSLKHDGTFTQTVDIVPRDGSHVPEHMVQKGHWRLADDKVTLDSLYVFEAGDWTKSAELWTVFRKQKPSDQVGMRGGVIPDPDDYSEIYKQENSGVTSTIP